MSIVPQVLTVREVASTAVMAYEAGLLGAQNIDTSTEQACLYRYINKPDIGCAIGVSLTDDTLDIIRLQGLNKFSITKLIDKNVISCDESETSILNTLQSYHDDWADLIFSGEPNPSNSKAASAYEKRFIEYARSLCVEND